MIVNVFAVLAIATAVLQLGTAIYVLVRLHLEEKAVDR